MENKTTFAKGIYFKKISDGFYGLDIDVNKLQDQQNLINEKGFIKLNISLKDEKSKAFEMQKFGKVMGDYKITLNTWKPKSEEINHENIQYNEESINLEDIKFKI